MFRIIKHIFWPSGGWASLFPIMGALSIIALLGFGFEFGISATFQFLLNYYDKLVSILIGWAEPFIEAFVSYLGLDINLKYHWKHVYVLASIYFSRNAWNTFFSGDKSTGIFEFLLGLVISGVVSVVAGQVPLNTIAIAENTLIGATAILGVFLYESMDAAWRATFYREKAARIYGQGYWTADGSVWYPPPPSWWDFFRRGLIGSFFRSVVAILILIVGVVFFHLQKLPSSGLFMIVTLIAVQAANFLRMGVQDSESFRKPDETWSDAYLRSGVAKVGMGMVQAFTWITYLLLLNAGLGLLKL